MYDALGHHKALLWLQLDGMVFQVDDKAAVEYEEKLIVLVGNELRDGELTRLIQALPHASFACLADYANSRGASDMGLLPDMLPGYQPLTGSALATEYASLQTLSSRPEASRSPSLSSQPGASPTTLSSRPERSGAERPVSSGPGTSPSLLLVWTSSPCLTPRKQATSPRSTS